MSAYLRRGGRGRGRGRSDWEGSSSKSTTITVSRPKDGTRYSIREKASSRSLSELSSLLDLTAADLNEVDVLFESSVMKVRLHIRQMFIGMLNSLKMICMYMHVVIAVIYN